MKAIEYFLKEKFEEKGDLLSSLKEYLHFSCTSEDINNLSYALMMHNSLKDIMIPNLKSLLIRIQNLSLEYADIPMMCRTHG